LGCRRVTLQACETLGDRLHLSRGVTNRAWGGKMSESRGNVGGAAGGAVYGLGLIGALVYFVYEIFHFLKL